jgi:uncharacterized protein YukE
MGIFTFIAGEIEDSIQQCSKQSDTCERTVSNIRGGLNPIQGGAWTGQGARAFIQEVITRVIPQIMELIAAIMGFGGKMSNALNIIGNADKMVKGIVGQVSSVFDKVF